MNKFLIGLNLAFAIDAAFPMPQSFTFAIIFLVLVIIIVVVDHE